MRKKSLSWLLTVAMVLSLFAAIPLTASATDLIAPVLTEGVVSRLSDTEATVKFTASEAGTYTYTILEDGAGNNQSGYDATAKIFEITSIDGVSQNSEGPPNPSIMSFASDTVLQALKTYHWNGGSGETPGTISIYENDTNELVGTWSAAAGQYGNVHWCIYPFVLLKAATEYRVMTSPPGTWSYTEDTSYRGMVYAWGHTSDVPIVCDGSEQTLSLTGLSAGEKDIYISYLDDAGNPSAPFKIDIPAYSVSSASPVSLLTIADAIAPINGGTPVTAITETAQYTGAISWEGAPETFNAGTSYTATITLTAKNGYTFDGVAENAFTVSSAASDSNTADSGVITATFWSPPNGYITDGNGIMAYRYGSSGQLDIKGFHSGSWLQTTFGDGGYRFSYILGERVDFSEVSSIQQYLNLRDQPIVIPETDLAIHLIPSFANGGKAVKLTYQIANNGTAPEIISLAGGSDVQIGWNDGAPMTLLDDGRGFMMFNGSDQFNFFGINTVGVTNVDAFWFGGLGYLGHNYFTQQYESSVSGVDSAMSYSWHNKTIVPGQTRNFSVLIGIGGAGSEIPTELGVMFDSRGGDDVLPVTGLTSGDTISTPTPPTRGGYTFGGWYTEPECTNQFSFTTPIIATITLYAKWTQNAPPSGGGSYTPPQYPVTDTNQGKQVGGQTKLSKERAAAGDTVIITVTLAKGYENEKPVVLDKDKNPVAVTDNGDGTFSFKMPSGGVSVDTKFTKIDYFDDVNEDDWFDEASWFCAAHGLMQGTGQRQFDGHTGSDRAMLVTVLYRLANSTDDIESIFNDVESGKWYSKAIAWAAHNKIVEGYGNGNFGPNDTLTREQMVAVLYRYSVFMKYDISKLNDLDSFTDADAISGWALAAMKWAVGNGIVEGVGNDLVSPETGATRAQFAAIMQRFCTGFVK